jgi:hypothetical protein
VFDGWINLIQFVTYLAMKKIESIFKYNKIPFSIIS